MPFVGLLRLARVFYRTCSARPREVNMAMVWRAYQGQCFFGRASLVCSYLYAVIFHTYFTVQRSSRCTNGLDTT